MKIKFDTILATTCLGLLCIGCAPDAARTTSEAEVPDIIKVLAAEKEICAFTASGVQIYACRSKKDAPAQFEWTLKGPEAGLFDGKGRKVGKHYAESGPVWESNDGSRVFGEVEKRADSPDATAIQWLLLKAKKTEGQGVFGHVTSIQRIKTVGGKAPTGGCDETNLGKELRVPYAATYKFYVSEP